MPKIVQTLEEKFLSRVNKTETCWLWIGQKDRYGYGQLRTSRKTPYHRSHRLAYTLFVGPIPDGLGILHSCDNPSCVNPAHLRPGTHKENLADMASKGRSISGKNQNHAKLKEDDIRAIRLIATDCKISHSEIAKIFGMTRPTISQILRGETWKNVK